METFKYDDQQPDENQNNDPVYTYATEDQYFDQYGNQIGVPHNQFKQGNAYVHAGYAQTVAAPAQPEPSLGAITDQKELILMENRRWRNRRRMAWLSLLTLISTGALSIFYITEERMPVIENVIITILFVLAGVVGAYMGLATLSESNFWTKK